MKASKRPARTVSIGMSALMMMIVSGCGTAPESSLPTPATGAAWPADIDALITAMSDEDLVGQVLMPYAYGRSATEVSPGTAAGNQQIGGVDTPAQLIEKYRLGGLILVGFGSDDPTSQNNPTSNVDSPAQLRALTDGLQAAATGLPAKTPLLIGIDQEYGVVTRLTNGVTMMPSAMAFGAANRPDLTETAWQAAGDELAAVGVNLNFAPVADVVGDEPGSVIGSRSFGSDPERASQQIAAAVRGLRAAGIAASLKHFPGHGHTTADSHTELPVLTQTRAELAAGDLSAFAAGIAAGAPVIMSGHLDVRSVDPHVPATFSHQVLTGLLRDEMGFEGVVVSDALNMAPAKRFTPGEAAVKALLAGNDLLLMPPDVAAAQRGLLDALASGRLPRERLIQAVRRVLALKLNVRPTSGDQTPSLSTLGRHADQVAPVAAAAVTLLRGDCGAPLVAGQVQVTAARGRDIARLRLRDAFSRAGFDIVDSGGTIVHLVGYGDTESDLNPRARITVAMDTPYLLEHSTSKVLLATYSSSELSLKALADVLTGQAKPVGTSPVELPTLPRSACR